MAQWFEIEHEHMETVELQGEAFNLQFTVTRSPDGVTAAYVTAMRAAPGNSPSIMLPDMKAAGNWPDLRRHFIDTAKANLASELTRGASVRYGVKP